MFSKRLLFVRSALGLHAVSICGSSVCEYDLVICK